ncbi:uncharacterized protein METZ01_LOCUS248695, partial [marine metagenome]
VSRHRIDDADDQSIHRYVAHVRRLSSGTALDDEDQVALPGAHS